MRGPFLLLALLVASCDPAPTVADVRDDPSNPLSPRYPGSRSIREPFVSNAEGTTVPGLECFPLLSTSGTDEDAEEVVRLYRQLGFRGWGARINRLTGEQTPGGRLARWIGDEHAEVFSY